MHTPSVQLKTTKSTCQNCNPSKKVSHLIHKPLKVHYMHEGSTNHSKSTTCMRDPQTTHSPLHAWGIHKPLIVHYMHEGSTNHSKSTTCMRDPQTTQSPLHAWGIHKPLIVHYMHEGSTNHSKSTTCMRDPQTTHSPLHAWGIHKPLKVHYMHEGSTNHSKSTTCMRDPQTTHSPLHAWGIHKPYNLPNVNQYKQPHKWNLRSWILARSTTTSSHTRIDRSAILTDPPTSSHIQSWIFMSSYYIDKLYHHTEWSGSTLMDIWKLSQLMKSLVGVLGVNLDCHSTHTCILY